MYWMQHCGKRKKDRERKRATYIIILSHNEIYYLKNHTIKY